VGVGCRAPRATAHCGRVAPRRRSDGAGDRPRHANHSRHRLDDPRRRAPRTEGEGDLAAHSGATLFTPSGTSAFGLLGSSNALDVPSLTVFAGRLLYSPDGVHWSSVTLAKALGFDANLPAIAVGDSSAILAAGLRAPGAQAQRFWLVTLR
jgi:hypothetical protein